MMEELEKDGSNPRSELGQWGEMVAREYLLTQGYAINGQNIRVGHYEIDFIAMKDGQIIFAEVKTRSFETADPADVLTKEKIRKLSRAADIYIHDYDIPLEPRFDLIVIYGSPEKYELQHYPDAFFPPLSSGK